MSLVPTTPERNKDLARIHASAKKLGLGEFQRRALQYDVTGKESCLLMSDDERRLVIDELRVEAARPAPHGFELESHANGCACDDCAANALGLL